MKSGICLCASLLLCIFVSSSFSQVSKTFKVYNKTGVTVTSLRFSSNDEYNWSLPLNTADKVPNNQNFSFTMKIDTARCTYDFKFTTEDGTDYIVEDVKLCEKPEFDLVIPEKKEP
jgi:hypothetical protein